MSYFDCFYSLNCTHFSNVSLLCVSPTFALEQKKMGFKVISLRLWHKFLTEWVGAGDGGRGRTKEFNGQHCGSGQKLNNMI